MFQSIKSFLENKKVLILGFGKEGKSTLAFIQDYIPSCDITVSDKNCINDKLPAGVKQKCGEDYMSNMDEYDVIIKSPGIVYSGQPENIINKTTSQTDLFLMEYRDVTIGITGTKGKSTTTTLLHHVMRCAGIDAVLAGNIGIPPLDAAREMKDGSIAVFEMSCHQLEFQKTSPHIAVILNLFEDHLDHYQTREKYVMAKENIFLHQSPSDILVIWDKCIEQLAKAKSRIITVNSNEALSFSKYKTSLLGEHNLFNIGVVKEVSKLYNIDDNAFSYALETYNPLPHRLEFVGTKNGVDYYDDSISTVSQTTIQAISSLKDVETVLIGGMDRGIDYTELIDFLAVNPVKNIILMYESGERIAQLLKEKNISYMLTNDLQSAVALASKLTERGKKCVLSPAAASYGYFKNFEERGDVFRELVKKL
ncbi:MAG: UDP-N-acetylmuramoyl-L-alanine--D-glutamate ligase [Ruminococcaceae bacterium]|nr:UDP-N-acetylmuramoyl-L-alanine--D-glutamate ligase [Oscillospiraceae bacterium]